MRFLPEYYTYTEGFTVICASKQDQSVAVNCVAPYSQWSAQWGSRHSSESQRLALTSGPSARMNINDALDSLDRTS